jgi:heme-degrading monooxygenase HmoA
LTVSLTIIRYPKIFIPFALFKMAIFRFPLTLNRRISFYKLLGCGKNGTFDKNPEWQQWGILAAHTKTITNISESNRIKKLYGSFINRWLRFFNCESWTILLKPIEGHGLWDGKEVFGNLPKNTDYNDKVAILTRATIRISQQKSFWQNVAGVADQMATAKGFIMSVGIGEMPFLKQATFSIWENKDAMKAFAYQMHAHQEVIRKTRKENWYSEDMFVRFIPLETYGTLKGNNPLTVKG